MGGIKGRDRAAQVQLVSTNPELRIGIDGDVDRNRRLRCAGRVFLMDNCDLGQRVVQRGDQAFELFAVLAAFTFNFRGQVRAVTLGYAIHFNNVVDLQVRERGQAIFELRAGIGGKGDIGGLGGDGEIRSVNALYRAVNVFQLTVVVVFIALMAGRRCGAGSHGKLRIDRGGRNWGAIESGRAAG